MRFVLIGGAIVAALVAHETIQPREREVTTRAAVAAIETYRDSASRHVGKVVNCRFEPTCSEYGLETVKQHGALRGGARALWRIARCNPWTPAGTVDRP
jgi:uncharacterized protein